MPFVAAMMSLLLPLVTPSGAPVEGETVHQGRGEAPAVSQSALSDRLPEWNALVDPGEVPVANQVRIESRVILRVSPQPSRARDSLLADLPQRAVPARLVERPMGRCLPASGIVGVSDSGSRLIIYMRDRSMISARLEKACSPRDFYLGFYMERSEDGQLCVDRDRLMSRAGAKCRISGMNQLVAVRPRD
ncbi:hypothetical protein K3172_11080 [Qipengyuania sp. 6B39]|uniref:hypothetical protein n=1 Tax=Qipengyuania proteolytica TaxID=2867239 RepID=UPI001C8A07EC|nr:hypothetical protein [Qipengyuania proteolytica]MBX7496397.1 hypothetical protein [Qipengyuania proteolytica]